ncbi:MAG: hypothetical protein LBQ47_01020, partial [Endomicrobium sp.]|nr:hypothetical protein [Endomicrobium sp.]
MKIFLRKTLLAFTSFAAAFIFTSNMNAVTVTDIDGLKALYNSAAAQNIELGNGIYSTGTRIGPAGAGLKTIDLKNFTLSFYNNSASVNGGVMDLSNASLVLTNGNVIFSSNTSSDYGGAVYAYGSEFTFSGENITFSGNTAATLGGAIFAQSSVFIFNGNSSFVNNTAAD